MIVFFMKNVGILMFYNAYEKQIQNDILGV